MNQAHNTSFNDYKRGSYSCHICGVRDTTTSYMVNHLGIYHKRLDFYNNFVMKDDLLTNSSNKLTLSAPRPLQHELRNQSSIAVNHEQSMEATYQRAVQVAQYTQIYIKLKYVNSQWGVTCSDAIFVKSVYLTSSMKLILGEMCYM